MTTLHTFSKTILLALAISATLSSNVHAVAMTEAVRSNHYLDDTRDGYLSDWKVMLTNAYPQDVLASGIWFDAAQQPRPFQLGKQAEFSAQMKQRLQANSTDALMVIKDGEEVASYYRFAFEPSNIHLVYSTGKAYVSFAFQPYYDRLGSKVLDARLDSFLPRLEGTTHGSATLQQALNMTVAAEWTEDFDDPNSHTMRSDPVSGWAPLPDGEEPRSWYTLFDLAPVGAHGKTWIYNSASVIASSFAMEKIAKKSFRELVAESYERLGFEDRSFFVANKLGELGADGGPAMTLRDFVKLGRFMLENQGKSDYVDSCWESDVSVAKLMPEGYEWATGYKNYWYKIGPDQLMALGSSGQVLHIDRKKNLVIGKFSSFVVGQGLPEFTEAFSIIADIAEQY